MAGIPRNIRGSASQLFFQDKQSPQYEALLAIADLPHPDRSILGSFINNAVDPQEAAKYFLHATYVGKHCRPKRTVSQFLSEWKVIINKCRPTRATSLSRKTRMLIYERDGGCCCLTRTRFKSYSDHDLEYVHMVPPIVFSDPDLSEGTALSEMLDAFFSRKSPENWRSVFSTLHHQGSEILDSVWLLSTQAFDAVRKGEVYFTVRSWAKHPDTTRKQTYNVKTNTLAPRLSICHSLLTSTITIDNRTPQLTPILNDELLGFHARFSESLAWMETRKQMNLSPHNSIGKSDYHSHLLMSHECIWSTKLFPYSLVLSILQIFRLLWISSPPLFRAFIYNVLLWMGSYMYGPTLSMTVYKLPFGLYLRRGSPTLAPKFHVEAHTLRLVEQFTSIPAPRAIDVLETSRFSYLLMTCVPGRPIGQMIDAMTDEEVKQVVLDLKRYISELRDIPNKGTGFQICGSGGGGILDWRIPDSQRDLLRFRTEAEFNKYLTDPFWEDIRRCAAISHDVRHKIVFTHGDLNPRNILAENGKITGIVDWENAGWFPEYWEYTKAHYTVRSLIRWLADVVDQVFEGYRDELVVENMLSDLLGPF